MTNAWDKGYNEGRLAFRRYFAKYGPNVKQNDPRMPPNPYVGFSQFTLNGFESELRRHAVFTPSTGGFRDFGERLPFRSIAAGLHPFASLRITSLKVSQNLAAVRFYSIREPAELDR